MYHSTSIHQTKRILSNSEDEQIHDTMTSLLDNIDRNIDLSNDSCFLLYNVSSNIHQHRSNDNQFLLNDDLFPIHDDNKHSSGILIDEQDKITRKTIISYFVFFQ